MDDKISSSAAILPKLHWYQFSLRSLLLFVTLCAVIFAFWRWCAIARPWNSVRPGMVTVTRVERCDDGFVVELRMTTSFEVALIHQMRHLDHSTIKLDSAIRIPSNYDLTRGHYVLFKTKLKNSVVIEANNIPNQIKPWSNSDAIKYFESLSEGSSFHEGNAMPFVSIADDTQVEEDILLYAGHNLQFGEP
jgi:hypothetical protein